MPPGVAAKGGRTKARRLRQRFGLGLDGPVPDLLALAETGLGVPVVIMPALPGDLAGAYLPRARASVIVLNGSDSAPRLRFTLAHELGHHVFGDDRQEDTHAGLVRPGHWIEVRANAFAAELLMPEPAVTAWAVGRAPIGLPAVVALASAFGTSSLATCIRLETAGIVTQDEAAALKLAIEAAEGQPHVPSTYEDSVSEARRHLPRVPPGSALEKAVAGAFGRAAAAADRDAGDVAAVLSEVAAAAEELV